MNRVSVLSKPRCIWNLKAELGEGVLWSPSERAVWFVDIFKNLIHRWCEKTGHKTSWETPKQPCFLASVSDQGLLVGLADGLYLFNPAVNTTFKALERIETNKGITRLNDGTVGPDRCLWFGSMDTEQSKPHGRWYRWDPCSGLTRLSGEFKVTNGPAFSPDGGTMYFCDSAERKILTRSVSTNGQVGRPEIFAEIESNAGYPDGLTVDDEGGLWVALFAGGAVRRYAPNGMHLMSINLPCPNITSPTFGGENNNVMYITTATTAMSTIEREKFPLAGGLFAIDLSISGARQYTLRLSQQET